MSNITTFQFNTEGFDKLKKHQRGLDWPFVYIIENNKEAYIGETINVFNRSKQHYKNPERKELKNIHIITDETYNKSATLDIESSLIQYMAADGVKILQNSNKGLVNHSYYDREEYKKEFSGIWDKLKSKKITKRELLDIKNSDLFKYSPYKSLTEDQNDFVEKIFTDIKNEKSKTYIINGQPGTGKTVLATYLVKYLKEHKDTKHLKIALVIPMKPLRKTLKNVFRNIKGLNANMVIIANDVARSDYDLVIVDEAHRLKRRKNLGAAFRAFDNINKMLGLNSNATHLDWIIKKSKHQIFFYDKNQNVMPTDVGPEQFDKLENVVKYNLTTQLRVQAGDKYIKFIENLLNVRDNDEGFGLHDFKLYDDLNEMVSDIKRKEKNLGLCRVVAGYAWPWLSNSDRNDNPAEYDIEIGDCKLKWNSTAIDWVNSFNAINEVGCIHTTQGYDLNYVGVIIGPELKYDSNTKKIYIDRNKYYDRNGRAGVTNDEELKRYIINIYKTLLTRGIKGAYVYVVDDNLRDYFKKFILNEKVVEQEEKEGILKPSFVDQIINIVDTIMIPLVGSAPCGGPILGEENKEDEVAVDKSKIKSGFNYFILRAEGDSMNLAGILDGDLVLCRQQLKADSGDRVIALLDDNVTIKMYDKKDGKRILLPKSNNPIHKPIIPNEGDSVLGIIQEVLKE
ncbi:MAG: DUF2075 domain-containing protein [Candidatus Pacebacteria bacterium]|nr:DUF2075 domain-containing protein [Candidatus Paceibacterota bacterium]